ncbi:MAG: SMP-30/gluconolactonase/LRE family protein [Methylococcales bacterium]|nr:SMP-30/gluconolactonase/LRE family protein [Methylococcales bacterium]
MTDTSTINPDELNPQLLFPAGNQLGEGVTYDGASDSLYWVDIPRSQIHLASDTGHKTTTLPVQPGFVAIKESGDLVAGGDKHLLVHADGDICMALIPDCDPREVVNDGVVSPDGRCLVFGTKDEKEEDPVGRMMVVSATEVIVYPSRFTVFNGPAFS